MQQDPLADITLTPRVPNNSENPYLAEAQRQTSEIREPGIGVGMANADAVKNPYLNFLQQPSAQPSQPPAIGAIASTLSINPDQAAQASKLGGQFGLGQDIALRNMEELRRQSLIDSLERNGTMERNPVLAQWMMNPSNAAQAHDDIDNLAETESWIDSISKGFEGGLLMQEMGELRFSPLSGERFYGVSAIQQDRIDYLRKRIQETQGSGILYMTAQVIAQNLAQSKGIATSALTGFAIGGATGGAIGAIAGGGVGAATGVVLTTAQMEAGLLYDELEQAGVDPETATTAAVIGGTINGAIELLGAKVAVAPFRPLIRKLIVDRVEALAMPTMRTAIRKGVTGYGIQVGTETLEETVQEITAMATSEIAKAADGIDSKTTWSDALTRITNAAIGGFQGSLLLGAIGPGAQLAYDTRRARQTEAQQKWLDGLQERVAESKVRERNPSAFQEFVEKQVEGKPVATIYVDAEEAKGVLAQLNLTVSQVDAIVPGFAEQVRAESERGGDVTIPTAVFSAKLANTDLGNALRPHMRLSPEALSVTQLEAVRAERERMSAAGQDVIDERLAAEDTAFVESAQRVEETMYGELTAAGQPATEAKINAEFVRNMMASLADRVGVTPEQMFERYPYRVRGEGQAAQAQALEQAVQPETLAMLTDEEVDQLADYAYEIGATQEDIDLIETEADRRFREEDDPAGEPDTTTGIGIEELLRDEAKRARQEGLSSAQLGEYIRNSAEFGIITQAAVQQGITDEQLGSEAYAALEAQEARVQAIKDRMARRKAQRPLEQAASRTALDVQHQEAIRAGDIATAQALTDSVAETRMPDSEVRDEAGKILRVFHGTQRIDRVGNRLLKKRATSGPMPFFTNTRAIAEGYAQGKQDTSIEDIGYEQWVKYTPKGKRSKVTLDQAWFYLTPEQKATATERLFTTGYENPEEGTGAIVGNTDTIASRDHVEYLLREARGNALTAAKELWLNSGSLFNNEQEFMDVLRGMGLTERFVYDSPHAVNSGILEVYLNITNPLDTAAIPESVVEALQRRANRIRRPAAQYGRDPWDKETRNPQEWMATLRSDIAEGKTQAWTSIPDWVTDVLRGLGYDGIKDMGGKFGGEQHTVWIPFEPEQVKFADAIAKDASGRIIPLSERFDVTSPMMFEQRPVTPGFYSALEREVGAIDAKALTADGWNQRLQGLVNKGVVKQDEIEWSGLKDWIAMQEGKVSKDTVLEFLRGNGVTVEVVRLGDRQQAVDQAAIDGSFVAEDNLRESDDGLTPEVEAAFNTFRTLIETGASREDIAEQRFIINDALDNAFGTDLDYYVESEYEARPETKYSGYTLPGGTNYREVLLTLPVSPAVRVSQQQRYREMVEAGIPLIEAQELATMSADDVQQRIFDLQKEAEPYAKRVEDFTRFVAPKIEGQTPFGMYQWFLDHQIEEQWRGKFDSFMSVLDDEERQWVTNRGYLQSLEQFQAINLRIMNLRAVVRVREYEARGFQSTHWNQPNVLVHLRMNDRVDADGKRVLFVEEVQSDWGQAGVKRGFINQRIADEAKLGELLAQQKANPTDARKKQIERVQERLTENRYDILRAPYVEITDGWLNLGLKQIMLEAVTGNYDRVAFVNGEQSAERYHLSHQVSRVVYQDNYGGKIGKLEGPTTEGRIIAYDKQGKPVVNETIEDPSELEDYVGKEVARRLLDAPAQAGNYAGLGARQRELSGLDLQVGGKGMVEFYDNIVPAAMNKLLKKYGGGKLGVATIDQTATDDPLSYEGEFRFRNEDDAEAFLTDVSIAGLEQYDYGRQDDGNIVSFRLPGNVYEQFRELAENRNGRYETPRLIQEGEIERPAVTKLETQQPAFDITPAMVEKLSTGLPLFQAARGLARGGFDPQKLLTTLNKDADFSTFAHETAHYFLTILGDVAARPDAPASVVDDMNTLLRWFGVKDLATWNAMSLDQQRQYHEQFAYSFETYLFEGKAPSVEMQGLFDQFARWLKQVYQGLITKINDVYKAEFGKDLPILTGEVRQVMDRMLATEDQIARAQAIREMKPWFRTQEQSRMDDATWAAYQELQEQATERAVAELTTATLKEMAWMSRARGRKLRELQRQHDDKRKEIKDEVTEDLRVLPVYRAMEFLRRGKVVDVDGTTKPATGQFKLSVAGVQGVMPPGFDVATLGRGRYGMVNEDGLHPDLIAPLYGYASGAELVTALSTAKPFADAVAERTDQRMLSEFSELADPAARSLAVDRAIHNEARARLIAVEQRWAAKLQQPVSVIMEAASQVAGEIIGRQTIRTLSPRAYAAAEARAARLATSAYNEPQTPDQAGQTAATRAYNEAIAAGKTVDEATAESLSAGVAAVEKARERRAEFDKKYGGKSPAEVMMRAKRQQLLQNMLARQALEARAEIDRARSAFKRFFGSDEKIGKTRNMEMVSAARAILGWYGFGKRDKSPAEYVDQLKAYNPAAYAQLEPLILRATKGPQDYRDLTVDEFRVLRDTVDGLWIQARKDKQVKLADRTMALDEVVGELDKRLEEIGVPKVVPGEKRAPTFRDRAARHLMTLRSTMRRVESWADSMDGVSTVRPFTNYLVRPVLEAVDKFTASRNKYMKRFRDLVVNLQMPEGTISAPELDYTFGAGNAGIGKAELLGALLHTGNESNYRKLLLGRGWGQEDEFGNLDDTQFKAFVKRMQDEGILTKADYDFLQSVWDLNEEIKPIAQKAHYELYGFYFTEIPASEVVTPFGTYRGGYVPAATDKFMVADAAQRAGEEELESNWRNSLPSTGRGFTKTRMAGYNEALSLDVRVIGAHIDSALRFAMIQPAITQALRILRSREFAARLDRVDPTVKQELLIPWLNRTARQLVSQPGKYKAVDAFWRGVRTRTGMSIMFANLRNALQQFTGLFPAGLKVQPRYLTSALTEYIGSPQRTANSVVALSPFMEDRLKGQSFEMQEQINEVLLNPSKFDKAQAWTDRHGYFLQQAFQNMVDVVTWVGAYNQSLSTADTTMTAEEAQREAIAAGDAAVRLTQGSVRPSDVSAFESGTPFFRTLTQFAGYFNMLANLNSTEYVKVMRDMGFRGNKGKLVYIYMMGFMLPAVVADAIVRTLGGGWEDEDEDGYLDTFMDWFFGSQIRQGVAFVPFGTTAYTLATTAFDDKPYNDRMTTSPSVASLEAATVGVGKAAIAVVDEEKDVTGKNVRDVLTFLSLATGIPFSVLGRPAGYLVDVQRGEVEPTSTYDMIRGTITGTATPESKR